MSLIYGKIHCMAFFGIFSFIIGFILLLFVSIIFFIISLVLTIVFGILKKKKPKFKIGFYICLPICIISFIPSLVVTCIGVNTAIENSKLPSDFEDLERIYYTDDGFISSSGDKYLTYGVADLINEENMTLTKRFSYEFGDSFRKYESYNLYETTYSEIDFNLYFKYSTSDSNRTLFISEKDYEKATNYYLNNSSWCDRYNINNRLNDDFNTMINKYFNTTDSSVNYNYNAMDREYNFYYISNDGYVFTSYCDIYLSGSKAYIKFIKDYSDSGESNEKYYLLSESDIEIFKTYIKSIE